MVIISSRMKAPPVIVLATLISAPSFAYEVIIDDTEASINGDWTESTYHTKYFGDNYLTTEIGDGSKQVEWRPDLSVSGEYEIFYWLPTGYKNRARDATFLINSSDGVTEIEVNQGKNAAKWVSMGTYTCEKGTNCYVSITNEATTGTYINADAIKFVADVTYESLENLALGKDVEASTTYTTYVAANAVDGEISDDSRWISNGTDDWLKVDLGEVYSLQCAHLYTGYGDSEAGISDYKLQYQVDGEWVDVPGSERDDNDNMQSKIVFDETVDAQFVRLISTDTSKIKVKEFELYGVNGVDDCPSLPDEEDIPEILVNQSGYNLNEIKRFTAPNMDDGTSFIIHKSTSSTTLYSGEIVDHIGDFSDFNPTDSSAEYVIVAGDGKSDPFGIGPYWYQRVTYDNLMTFMDQARCYVGNVNSCLRGVSYRDGHAFSFEMSSLIALYFSNPSYHENRERTISYVAGYGPLDAPDSDAPDIVKLIHFVADRLMDEEVKNGLLKAQLAQFLYVYPYLSDWISEDDYQAVLDYLVPIWDQDQELASSSGEAKYNTLDNQNMLAVVTEIGGYKGNLPPGYAIKANLMMYEVALREDFDDAEQYFDAAYNQTEWLIENVDWNSKNTKGQRMSEHITMEALHYFMKMYPDRAPSGLQNKIEEWIQRAIEMSDNMWDFRRYSDDYWVIPDGYNEPGNVAGLPASLNAAIEFAESDDEVERLKELSASHLDAVFGRNPTARHFSYTAADDFEGVERGYYTELEGGVGRLEGIPGKLDGSAKESHFPFNPDVGAVGTIEAWVAFNTAWNSAVAYHDYAQTKVVASIEDGSVSVILTAPLDLDYDTIETGYVYLESSSGDEEKVLVVEDANDSMTFSGDILYETGSANSGDGVLQVEEGDTVEVSYGYDFLKNSTTLSF